MRKLRIRVGVAVGIAMMVFVTRASPVSPWQEPQPVGDPAYRNVQILMDAAPDQLQQIMAAVSVSLGVECEYCHEAGDWGSDEKVPKRTARNMMSMLADADERHFETLESPSCWTCHRGSPTPDTVPPPTSAPGDADDPNASFFSAEELPSGDVYRNIQNYVDLPANRLQDVMEAYSRALDVGCDHCHVEGEWASDAMLMKLMARRMFEIQEALAIDYMSRNDAISCWTCHRGETLPLTTIPAGLLPP